MEELSFRVRRRHLDVLFALAFSCSFGALTLTHYLLANGFVEMGLLAGRFYMFISWLFAAQWACLFAIYLVLRSGRFVRSDADAAITTLFPILLFFFCFVDFWNDVLVLLFSS
ncbi:hypothetical protein [Candidatus Alkanophaga liquidiphilum]|nr:hypothetical protein [Candidatus Alkanophaga liquidiphilum]RLG39311.1 MAG: hypothetical protein DRN91_00040 [Candidatus Alkanophagales archaeon]